MHSRVVWTNYLVKRGETILDYTLINCTNKLIKASRAVNAMLTNQNKCTDNGDSRVMIFTCGLRMFTWRAFIKNTMIRDCYDIILGSSQLATKPLFMLLNQAGSLNSEVIYGSLLQVLFHVYGINKTTLEKTWLLAIAAQANNLRLINTVCILPWCSRHSRLDFLRVLVTKGEKNNHLILLPIACN